MMERNYKKVSGKLPRKPEIGEWSNERILSFLNFAAFFMKEGYNRSGVKAIMYDVSDERIATAWESDDERWQEFLERLTTKDMEDSLKAKRLNAFRTRLMNFIRVVCAWLKSNPHAVTIEIEQVMRSNPRFSWALDPYVARETDIGGLMVVPNDGMETVSPDASNVNPHQTTAVNIAVRYQNALTKATTLLEDLLGSIDRNQIRNLPLEKKLKYAKEYLEVLGKLGKDKPGRTSIFNFINTQKTGREDLERQLLESVES